MSRIDVNGEGSSADANQSATLSGSDRRLGAVIPFVRRADAAASVVPAGAVETSSAAPFIPLGELTRAVVLRLANDAVRLQVLAPVLTPWEEEEEDWDEL